MAISLPLLPRSLLRIDNSRPRQKPDAVILLVRILSFDLLPIVIILVLTLVLSVLAPCICTALVLNAVIPAQSQPHDPSPRRFQPPIVILHNAVLDLKPTRKVPGQGIIIGLVHVGRDGADIVVPHQFRHMVAIVGGGSA